jgi:hypothetical protein
LGAYSDDAISSDAGDTAEEFNQIGDDGASGGQQQQESADFVTWL